MGEISRIRFDSYMDGLGWPQDVRDIMRAIAAMAESTGTDVIVLAHESAGGSIGLAFRRGRRVFVRADPKPAKGHVCVSIPGSSDSDLGTAGRVHRRKGAASWVDVTSLAGVEALRDELCASYRRAGD